MIRRVQQQVSSYCIQIQLRALAFACMAFWLLEGLFISFSLLSHSLSLSTHGILLQPPPIIIQTLVLNHEDANYQNPPRGGQAGSTRGLEPKRNRQGQKEE